jgi:hypothetical protein
MGLGGTRPDCRLRAVGAIIILLAVPADLAAQTRSINPLLPLGDQPPIPPAAIPNVPANPTPISPEPALPPPGGGAARPAPVTAPSGPSPQAAPIVPAGQIALALSARFGRDPPAITGALLWRVYKETDPSGGFRLVREERSAQPVLLLPPGGYIVHVTFGLANAVKRVQLGSETVREVFEIPAGGARFEGKVGDVRIPAGQILFDVYKGSQFEPGDKRAMADNVASGDVVLLPEGTYHVVSNYGSGNSVMRSDLRIQPGKLTDTTIVHRAAKITLKLVSEEGGEALANTAWSVLTPGGDVIKESIGAFPVVILAEGEYVAIARNEGRVYNREFKVESGVDREVEVLAR